MHHQLVDALLLLQHLLPALPQLLDLLRLRLHLALQVQHTRVPHLHGLLVLLARPRLRRLARMTPVRQRLDAHTPLRQLLLQPLQLPPLTLQLTLILDAPHFHLLQRVDALLLLLNHLLLTRTLVTHQLVLIPHPRQLMLQRILLLVEPQRQLTHLPVNLVLSLLVATRLQVLQLSHLLILKLTQALLQVLVLKLQALHLLSLRLVFFLQTRKLHVQLVLLLMELNIFLLNLALQYPVHIIQFLTLIIACFHT